MALGVGLGGRLHHHAHQLLCARRPEQHPASVAKFCAHRGNRLAERAVRVNACAVAVGNVDEHLRQRLYARSEFCERAVRRNLSSEHKGRQYAVARGGVVGENHVPGLLAAKRVTALAHRLEHVAVANGGFDDGDVGLAHCTVESKVAHHGGHQRAAIQRARALHR